MQMKDRTKLMFADTLIEMIQTTPLSKIRVAKLCEKCGATPPTFYYYFHDKYELVAWIFLNDYTQVVTSNPNEYTPDILETMTNQFELKKQFYQKDFDDQ